MSETREDAPIKTVTVRGEEIHPACMTVNEALLTIMLNFKAGEGRASMSETREDRSRRSVSVKRSLRKLRSECQRGGAA